ncbi:hypothetical protein [Almyronema epifaneia]|uniref:Uncharacterized protein n=1 Tax=Almyronema epifaneia S1 TaxID=2991925 RepID=A0ABW6IJK2_9CYAN
MPIDPYEPELAKRKTALSIADRQLKTAMSEFQNASHNASARPNSDVKQPLEKVLVALKDYAQTAKELTEWIDQKQGAKQQ